jgi:hypothetical protein
MVEGYLASGDIAPQIIWANGPAFTAYSTSRDGLYGWSATPTFQINGAQQVLGWTQSSVVSAINSELALPCYLTIGASYVGNASGGTVTYTLTASQDLVDTQMAFWAAIVEDHDIATSDYGVYSGQELMWEPRAFPVGTSGQTVTFTGPYPQTITINGSYTLTPSTMTFNNLMCVAYLQKSTADHRVLNASFVDLPDTNTGVGDVSGSPVIGQATLSIGPNPTTGTLNIYSIVPTGSTGTISIYDINGRIVDNFSAGSAMVTTLDTPGVYFVRMQTSSGEILTRSCTVLR